MYCFCRGHDLLYMDTILCLWRVGGCNWGGVAETLTITEITNGMKMGERGQPRNTPTPVMQPAPSFEEPPKAPLSSAASIYLCPQKGRAKTKTPAPQNNMKYQMDACLSATAYSCFSPAVGPCQCSVAPKLGSSSGKLQKFHNYTGRHLVSFLSTPGSSSCKVTGDQSLTPPTLSRTLSAHTEVHVQCVCMSSKIEFGLTLTAVGRNQHLPV